MTNSSHVFFFLKNGRNDQIFFSKAGWRTRDLFLNFLITLPRNLSLEIACQKRMRFSTVFSSLENVFDVLFNLAFLLIIVGGVIFIVSLLLSVPGLPDGLSSNKKSQFG
jgi:hypothetical protein